MLGEFAQRVFDKFASSKAAKLTFLLHELARRANLSINLGTLLDNVKAPLDKSHVNLADTMCKKMVSKRTRFPIIAFGLRRYVN
jgi:hypothetical protein